MRDNIVCVPISVEIEAGFNNTASHSAACHIQRAVHVESRVRLTPILRIDQVEHPVIQIGISIQVCALVQPPANV